jgi:purine-cytosine permease-like protein
MVRVLRSLIVPFIIIYAVLSFYIAGHLHLGIKASPYANWQLYTAGLAFVIALSGLGWTECGNDYTRYLPRETSKGKVVGWIFLATALPQIVMMTIGAMTFTFLSDGAVWNGANPFLAFEHQNVIPGWFVVVFMIFAIVQLFCINSLDLYSSGVSLQALGLKLRRYQAVVLDSVIALFLTTWAVFGSKFSLYMKEFVGVIIVWIAPWFAILMVDWLLRKYRYHAGELQRTDRESLYYGHGGFNWNAIVSFVVGLVLATMAFSKAPPPSNFPFHWMTPISNHYGASFCDGTAKAACGTAGWFGGADFSVFLGIFSAGLLYFILDRATGYTKKQRSKELEAAPAS